MKAFSNIIVKMFIAFLAILIVIASHYAWQWVRTHSPYFIFTVYCVSFVLLVLGGYFIIRRLSQNSYKKYQKLSNTSLFLVCTNWGVFFALPSLYNPYNWAWSFSSDVTYILFVRLLSYFLIIIGLVGLIASMQGLGIPHSISQISNKLKTDGLYRFTRNPQIVTGTMIVIGYVILRPSWYALGWLILLFILAHFMIISEEEHLLNIFGEEYKNYCLRTPRYLRIYLQLNKIITKR